MTKEEIIELAKLAGIDIGIWEKLSDNDDVFGYDFCGIHENLEAFAKLLADKEREAFTAHAMTSAEKAIDVAIKLEREACAKLCDYVYENIVTDEHIKAMAFKIRARGQA